MAETLKPVLDQSIACACGAVTMTVAGPVLSMLMCSCLDCQRATGTGHAAVVMLRRTAVTIAGMTKSHASTADSGAQFTRSFCPECGTPVMGVSSRAPDHLLLPIGLFGQDAGWFAPTQLIFARSLHDWDSVPLVPHHQRYRESTK